MAGSNTMRLPFGLIEPLGGLRALDAVIGGYITLALFPLALGAARGVPGCGQQLHLDLALLAGLALVCLASRHSASRLLILLRLAYGPLVFALLYRQTATIWPVLYEQPFDAWLVRGEETLWGGLPALAFAQHAPWPWLSELFCMAYYAYYFFTPAMLFTVLLRRGYIPAERVMFATALCFCTCYALFWLFPVLGPHYWFAPHTGPQPYQGYLFSHLLYVVTSGGEVRAGAFPSSHIAVAVVLTLQARRLAPRLFPFMAVVTAMMFPAVVYLRAHYLIDVPAGIVVGLLITHIVDRIPLAGATHRPLATDGPPV